MNVDADHGLAAVSSPDVLRRCAMCDRSKPSAEFHRSRTGQFSYCRDCRCAYDRRYYAERGKVARLARQRAHGGRERAWMESLKNGVPCADCGETFPPFVMHWDHLPGHVKIDEIGSMVGSRRRELILTEMEKCQLVCANCHVMRTVERARRGIAHDAPGYRRDRS